MEEELSGSRVTRSLRKRLNSTDQEFSPVSATPKKNDHGTPLDAIVEVDLTSESDDPIVGQASKVVRTRARVNSTLTVENVRLHSSPARRQTRRSVGAAETPTPTQVRRSLRASSITSDDVSIASSVPARTRRIINIETLKEEDDRLSLTSTSPISTRSTGHVAESPIGLESIDKPSSRKALQLINPKVKIEKIALADYEIRKASNKKSPTVDSSEQVDVDDSSKSINSSVTLDGNNTSVDKQVPKAAAPATDKDTSPVESGKQMKIVKNNTSETVSKSSLKKTQPIQPDSMLKIIVKTPPVADQITSPDGSGKIGNNKASDVKHMDSSAKPDSELANTEKEAGVASPVISKSTENQILKESKVRELLDIVDSGHTKTPPPTDEKTSPVEAGIRLEIDDSFQSTNSSITTNEINTSVGTPLHKTKSRCVSFDSTSVAAGPSHVYPKTPISAKKPLEPNEAEALCASETVSQLQHIDDNKASDVKSMDSSAKPDPESTETRILKESKVRGLLNIVDSGHTKTPPPTDDKTSPVEAGIRLEIDDSFQSTNSSVTINEINTSVGKVNNSTTKLDSESVPTANEEIAGTPLHKTKSRCVSFDSTSVAAGPSHVYPKTPISAKKPLEQNEAEAIYASETVSQLQHSDESATGLVSPQLNVRQRGSIKHSLMSINSSTPNNQHSILSPGKIVAQDKEMSTKPKALLVKSNSKPDCQTIKAVEPNSTAVQQEFGTFSRSWSQSVVGKTSDLIDCLALKNKTEEQVIMSANNSVASVKSTKELDDHTFDESHESNSNEDENSNTADKHHPQLVKEFFIDEAEESEGDSMDEEERQYLRDNEIPENGIHLGTDDSSIDPEEEHNTDNSLDSFIVSESEAYNLIESTDDDLSREPPDKVTNRKSHRIEDTSDDESDNDAAAAVSEIESDASVSKELDATVCDANSGDEQTPIFAKSFVEQTPAKKNAKRRQSVGGEDVPYTVKESGKKGKRRSLIQVNTPSVDEVHVAGGFSMKSNSLHDVGDNTVSLTAEKSALSQSLVDRKSTKKLEKLNKSLGGGATSKRNANPESPNIKIIPSANDAQEARFNLVSENTDTDENAAAENESHATPDQGFEKTDIVTIKKRPNYDNILWKCDMLMNKALEEKRQQKLLNKNAITEEKVEKLKKKKKQKQLAKAKRAAALIEIEKQASEKAEKKRLKKQKLPLKLPAEDVSAALTKAINHGVALLRQKASIGRERDDVPVIPATALPTQTNSKKRKLNTSANETNAKNQQKFMDHSTLVIKQGQAKRKQQPPTDDFVADTVIEGTLKKRKRKLARELSPECAGSPPRPLAKKNKATPIVQYDDVSIPPKKKLKKSVRTPENADNNSCQAIGVPSAKIKKKLNILLAKNNETSAAAAKSNAPDAMNVQKIPAKPKDFKERSIAAETVKKPKQKKRKEIVERVTVLPKPQWTTSGAFEVSKLSENITTNAAVLRVSTTSLATDFAVTSLKPKVHKTKLVSNSASDFKQRAMFNDHVKRESSKQLLQRKEKQLVYTRF